MERPGLLSPQVAAVVWKEFRYMTRNGFAFLTLLIPPMMVVVFYLPVRAGIDVERSFGEARAVFSRNHGLSDFDYADRLPTIRLRSRVKAFRPISWRRCDFAMCCSGKNLFCAGARGI